jgi:hypothetical protein
LFGIKERRELIAKLEEHRLGLMEIVATLDEKAGDTPLKPGGRSPKGQLLYVWGWARCARDEEPPDLSQRDPDATGEFVSHPALP